MKNLNLYYTKKGTLREEIKKIKATYEGNGIFRTLSQTYNKGWVNETDLSNKLITILKDKRYKYKEGNDAPRGGKVGTHIKVSKRAAKKIMNIPNESLYMHREKILNKLIK